MMQKNNDHSEVSWGNVLADDALVWLPHALCRHADKLELTFDDIGFIAQCFSFRGKTGIHPSESTLAIRGGYNTRNPIINRFKRLEEMNLINRHRIRYEDGTFGTYRYDFSPLREKLEQLVKAEWASGERKPKQRSDSKEPIHVDDNQHGEHQHDDHQHDERQQKKHKGIETQGFRNTKESSITPVSSETSTPDNPGNDDDDDKEIFEGDLKKSSQEGDDKYFLSIEQYLDKKNIVHTLVGTNFIAAKKMYERAVPIELVLKTIDEVLANVKGKKIKSFKYFESAIWENFNCKKASQNTSQMTEILLEKRRLAREKNNG